MPRYSREGTCRVDGCESVRCARGYCAIHYERDRRHGDPEVVVAVRRDHEAPWPCARCGETKDAEAFPLDSSRPGRRHPYCKPCKSADGRERRARYVEEHGAEAYRRLYLDGRLRRTYGITLAEYEAILVAQGGGCATCGTPEPTGNHGRLVVDHDHATGAVRGILCGNCNTAAGLLGDDPATAAALAAYLSRFAAIACADGRLVAIQETHAGERPAAE